MPQIDSANQNMEDEQMQQNQVSDSDHESHERELLRIKRRNLDNESSQK